MQRFTHAPSVLGTTLSNGEIVMMDIDIGNYFGLEDVAVSIWEFLATPQTIDDLVAELLDTYEVDPKICETKTRGFVDELLKHKLLITAD